MTDLKSKLKDAWEDGEHDQMKQYMRLALQREGERYDKDINQVGFLKQFFESDLPHNIVKEVVGCDRATCRRVRWMGQDYGAVDRHGRSRDSIPPSVRREIHEECDYKCVRCGSEDDLEVHHIIPVSHGGLDLMENLVVVCESCNYDCHAGDYSSKRTIYDGKNEFWKFVEEYDE